MTPERVVAREIEALRAAGVLVALDDFGTGYASLTHLLEVPVDIIKIDQAFISRLCPEDPSRIIINGLISIAEGLDIRIMAEGVETQAQADQLWAMGCRYGQGYAFARPADRWATELLLRHHGQGTEGARPLRPCLSSASEDHDANMRAVIKDGSPTQRLAAR